MNVSNLTLERLTELLAPDSEGRVYLEDVISNTKEVVKILAEKESS